MKFAYLVGNLTEANGENSIIRDSNSEYTTVKEEAILTNFANIVNISRNIAKDSNIAI